MTKKDDDFLTPATKKIRFRGDLNSYYFENHIEDILEDADRRKPKGSGEQVSDEHKNGIKTTFSYLFMNILCLSHF